ncbi:hypothetical protein GCM10007320_08620 [Pseudorhodoferax aquiterrae]|uniref:Tip attachment protein J central straight fiber domain-containing protein n=2 Tax=Pseudorhodoferax aquiterrae TaxID=747304 RepID=A0ABQ3FXU6_9BURK|nr:hypothetical protein GCM10007320_08620 [Pseudorhodoferax aquiterrae]
MGKTGPASARAVTIGDLAGGGSGLPGGGWGGGGSAPYVPDLTPPPTPTGFAVSAAISHVFIEHDAPLYLMGHGHAKTRVFGAKAVTGQPMPTFANAVLLTEFTGIVYAYPSDPATHWRLWIKWVTVDGVESTDPAGGTNGLGVVTGQDVALLLDALTGKITESELYAALGQRIDLIDGNGVGSVNARVAAEASTRSTVDGYLGAQQTVRIDVAGHVTGYGLAGSSPDGSGASATSSFGVRANTFFVAPPALAQATAPTTGLYDGFVWLDTSLTPAVTRYRSGGTWTLIPPALPFVIQTTPTTINGVAVPAGVYANDLFVKNGTITNAKIGNLAVDDAKIANLSVSKILAGSMVVGQYITSANYVAGVQGWAINAAGNAEFQNATLRGTVYASAGSIGGILINGSAIYSSNYTWQGAGFLIDSNGNAYFNNLWSRGSVMGGSYYGYAWPAAGSTGFYLGPEGLLVGNANNGRYFQLDSQGNVYAPNFSIVNGNAYFNGSGTFNGNGTFSGNLSAAGGTFNGLLTASFAQVDTLNVAGGAVTSMRVGQRDLGDYFMGSPLVYVDITMPAGSSGVVLHGTAEVRIAAASSSDPLVVSIVREGDGAVLGSGRFAAPNSTLDTLLVCVPVVAFDPSPVAGYGRYYLRVSGAGLPATWTSNVGRAVLTATGGKR